MLHRHSSRERGVLGHSRFAVVGYIANRDAVFPGGPHVNGVVASGQGSHIPQVRQLGKFLPAQDNPVKDGRLSASKPFQHQAGGRFAVNRQLAQLFQRLPGQVPGLVVPPSRTTIRNATPPFSRIIQPKGLVCNRYGPESFPACSNREAVLQ